MQLIGMVEWEEWEWEEQVQAMPRLEKLVLENCKRKCVPLGLASNARALKKLTLEDVQNLSCIENFPSVIELVVIESPDRERITNLPSLQKLAIINCSKLKVLDSIPALMRLILVDFAMEKLPEYMRDIKSRHLELGCRVWLLAQLGAGQSGTEWDKFSHVEHVEAYAPDENKPRKWYMVYTKEDNFKLASNISRCTVFEETLSSSMVDEPGFESLYKMRSTFSYVCSLVRIPFLEDMMARDHTFVDGRVLSLQDRVAVALRMLSSGKAPEIVGSSVGVNESTFSLVTQRFVDAMRERAMHHLHWPGSAKIEKIKRKFDKIQGLPNCCGVVHTAHIKFGSEEDRDHEENDGMLMQVVVGPDTRFTNIWLGPSASMNQSSILHDSRLFKECQEGTWLNGSKLKVSSGGGQEVGEYIIGDAGYPLLPWLLTPYHLEDKELTEDLPPYQAEFNRRHSSASVQLARLRDTWKILDSKIWRSLSCRPYQIIYTCCMLHNIVIDMEEEEDGAGLLSDQEEINYIKQVRQLAEKDAAKVRDALSQHMIESRVAASGSGDENKGGETSLAIRN